MALGLTGRYLGGQATHRGKGSLPVGEDPDQSAGWLGQSKEACQRCLALATAREVFTWKPSSRSGPLFQQGVRFAANDVLEDCVDQKLTFSLVLTVASLTDSLGDLQVFFQFTCCITGGPECTLVPQISSRPVCLQKLAL